MFSELSGVNRLYDCRPDAHLARQITTGNNQMIDYARTDVVPQSKHCWPSTQHPTTCS